MKFTLHIVLMGFFAFVPQASGPLYLLVPDLRFGMSSSDPRVPIPPHRPLLVYSCSDLTGGCQAADRQPAALKDLADINESSGSNVGARQLSGYQISVVGNVETQPPLSKLPDEIADMSVIEPTASKVDPDLIAQKIPDLSQGTLAARAALTNISDLRGTPAQRPDVNNQLGDVVFDFTPLKTKPSSSDYRHKLFEQIDIAMVVADCSVKIQIDDFNGNPVATIPLQSPDCSDPSSTVTVELINQSICTKQLGTKKCQEAEPKVYRGIHHFQAYYELSNQSLPLRHRKVPWLYTCGGNACNPAFDGMDRPICPNVKMVP